MAQSQLSSPYAEGRQTPRNQLRVDVSESEQMETENEISGNESTYTPRKGTKTRSPVMGTSKNTPFRGTRKSPVQGTRNNTDIGVRSSSESPERERLRTKRKRKYKKSSDEVQILYHHQNRTILATPIQVLIRTLILILLAL